MTPCAQDQSDRLRDRVRFLARRFSASAGLAGPLRSLSSKLDSTGAENWRESAVWLRELSQKSPVVQAAMEEYDDKESVDRAEAFLADLAEDRTTAPAEIVPLIDHYITRLREVIGRSWEGQLRRREVDAAIVQVRMSYSQDLDRILQSLQIGGRTVT
jgi:hypothetical protein